MAASKKNDDKKEGEQGDKKKEASEKLMVAVRVRPLKSEEKLKGWFRITQVVNDKIVVLQEPETQKNDHLRQKRKQDKQFVYDVAFGEDSTQKEVYDKTTKALIEDVCNGFNATVFAYGATGAGKTFTMVGTPDHPGIMVRALNDLFLANKDSGSKTEITMSYLEIYNENIRDLLKPSSGTLELREDAKTGVIQVAGLSEASTNSTKEVMALLTKGNKERTCEPTAANKTSSRSHALLQVSVKLTAPTDSGREEVKQGRLYMIDLAGSERAKKTQNQGKRLQEGAHINRSLLALGNCINALAEGRAKYVNFRDSKLTRLLKDALSGNCRTVMIAHTSPAHLHREETRNTLIYADRAKNISNKVKRNVLDVSYHVSQYQTIITELKDEITRLKSKISNEDNDEAEKKVLPTKVDDEEEEKEKAKNYEKLKKLKNDLVEHFREQMSLRNKLMDIDNTILALTMEFERQNMVVTEWEVERARRARLRLEANRGPDGEEIIDMDTDKDKDEDSDDEEPEEVSQAWEDLVYLQKEQQRYTEMRDKIEQEMTETKARAKELEEALPEEISSDEQRELLGLLCKVHELEIQKVEMQSEALLKEHEIRRRDLLILRYDRQKTLCEAIINRQRQIIDALQGVGITEVSPTMPPELQELYGLYQMEVQSAPPERELKYLADLNGMLRSPSMLSLRAPSFERLPPIGNNNREPEKLFDKTPRRHSIGEERPDSALSLRSPTSSASSSAPGTAPSSRVPSLPPIRGAAPPNDAATAAEMRLGLRNINAVAASRRRGSRAGVLEGLEYPHHAGSLDALETFSDPDSPGFRRTRRKSYVYPPSDDSLSIVSLRLDSPPRRKRNQSITSLGAHRGDNYAHQRRRRGSGSSSDGDSPVRPKYKKDMRNKVTRRRGTSLTRVHERKLGQGGIWAAGNTRRPGLPGGKRNPLGSRSPDALNQVGFSLQY